MRITYLKVPDTSKDCGHALIPIGWGKYPRHGITLECYRRGETMQDTKDTRYNGWANYETWSVALIANNDEGTYNQRIELVQEWITAAGELGEDVKVYEVADAIKDWVESWPEIEAVNESDGGYLVKQLLDAALGEVDWFEIAEHWIEDAKQQ
jgi:hypothetical protein